MATIPLLPALAEAFHEWQDIKAQKLGAAISYYAIFSAAPLLTLIVMVAGIFLQRQRIESQLFTELANFTGSQSIPFLKSLLDQTAGQPNTGIHVAISAILILLGATGVVIQLQEALDAALHHATAPRGPVFRYVRDRAFSLFIILLTGLVLVISVLAGTALSALGTLVVVLWPDSLALLRFSNLLASFALVTVMFSLTYRYLPRRRVPWRHIIPASLFVTCLFYLGKAVLTVYLAQKNIFSVYGASGAVVLLLLWTYYSAQIYLFGATYMHVRLKHEHL